MKALPLLLLLLVLVAACRAGEPETVSVSGEQEIEATFDQAFHQEDVVTSTDDLDQLESDLALS